MDVFLDYGGDEEQIEKGYVDASFNIDLDDAKSQTGYIFLLNGGAVSWKSSKQSIVARSTIEAEHMDASEAVDGGILIKNFVTKNGVVPSILDPMEIYYDNIGTIVLTKDPRSHPKTKHIARFHIIHYYVTNEELQGT
jgi:hypothetical protein